MKHFWQEHRSRLCGYIAKRARERDAVGDILQGVFLKVNASLQAIKPFNYDF